MCKSAAMNGRVALLEGPVDQFLSGNVGLGVGGWRRGLPQYSECGSPRATFENQFFCRHRIANITNSSITTLLFYIKSISNINSISAITFAKYLSFKST